MIGATYRTTPRRETTTGGKVHICFESVPDVVVRSYDTGSDFVMIASASTGRKHKGNITINQNGYDSDS
ncbi:MAG: hypothetical protein ACYSSI_05570 [Planctomycetota bacterium]